MPKQKLPTTEEIAHLTISELEMKYRSKRSTVLRTFLHQLHGRRAIVLVGSAFILALILFFVWVGDRPIRATYAGERLTQSVWAQLETTSNERIAATQVTLQSETGERTFSAAELGVRFDEASTRELIESSELKRKVLPWQLIDERAYMPTLSVDKTVLLSTLGEAGLLNNKPVDASVRINGATVEVTPGEQGMSVDINTLASQLLDQAMTLESTTIRLPLVMSDPAIGTEEAEQTAASVRSILDRGFGATYPGGEYRVPAAVIAEWIVFESKPDEKRIVFRFDEARVRQHAEQFAASLTRDRRDSVVYRTPSGEQVVSVAGIIGRRVTNIDAITAAWSQQGDVIVEVAEEPFAVRDGGLLTRYIIVDLASHTATAHDSDTVVATFPISGGKPSTPTPLGTFRIFAKTRAQTMWGPGYSTPNVEWISWFYPDYALHGAYWHNDFGIANVSRGCVNLRNGDAEWIYNWAPIGTTVIVR